MIAKNRFVLPLLITISSLSLYKTTLKGESNTSPVFETKPTSSIFGTIPEGFTIQVLEPTGGKILKPKDWFYNESHQKNNLTWIISKEDASISRYDTGVRIQTIIGIKEKTGISAEESLRKHLASKKEGAKQIFHECEPTERGLFKNMCIHVEEGPYRIFYSIFWSNEMDIAVIMTGGTKLEDWDKYKETFGKMSHFELIDMSRVRTSEPQYTPIKHGISPYQETSLQNTPGFVARIEQHYNPKEPKKINILIPKEIFEGVIGHGERKMCLGLPNQAPTICSDKRGRYEKNKNAPYLFMFNTNELKSLPDQGTISVVDENGKVKLSKETDFRELKSLANRAEEQTKK
jgi:hypothetical protein